MSSLKIKWIATQFGIEKLVMKQGKMIAYFVSDHQSAYYQSSQFTKVLQFVQTNPKIARIKEKETPKGLKLLLTFDNVKSVRRALELLQML
jgi:transcription-repair coupling factor (superfamily II helicase)